MNDRTTIAELGILFPDSIGALKDYGIDFNFAMCSYLTGTLKECYFSEERETKKGAL